MQLEVYGKALHIVFELIMNPDKKILLYSSKKYNKELITTVKQILDKLNIKR